MKERCILIPAIKKNAIIPDQLVKSLAGITLIQRAINTARACAPGDDIIVLTDSEEISLICERNNVRFIAESRLKLRTWDIVSELRGLLSDLSASYAHCLILRPSCPLLTWVDVEDAWRKYLASGCGSLISVRKVRQRLWRAQGAGEEQILAAAAGSDEQEYVVETRALIILSLDFSRKLSSGGQAAIPYFMGDRGIEILGYQDWWICERLLTRRHLAFVVAGYPAIGMGHVYRALMLAHEISAHKITFVCTRDSALAVESIASRDYEVIRQGEEELEQTVLGQMPDLVINDFLNTSEAYMRALRQTGISCVNFEDEGPGASLAQLVINALENDRLSTDRVRRGPAYFCLRDEFLRAQRNAWRPDAKTALITFGGTDQHDAAGRVLRLIEPVCKKRGIAIRIVAGPGYAHKQELEARIARLRNPAIEFTWATNIMSRMMEGVDVAITSAGRTVYELAWMRVPGLVLATHEREARHGFARLENGFAFAGLMAETADARILELFLQLLEGNLRHELWQRQNSISFAGNKARVIGLIMNQLELTEKLD